MKEAMPITEAAARAVAPQVSITLDKERQLTMDLNVLAAIEEKLGAVPTDEAKKWNVRTLRAMLTASLQVEDSSLTEAQVGRLVHPANLKYVTEKFNEVWKTNTESADEVQKEGGEDPLAKATGRS